MKIAVVGAGGVGGYFGGMLAQSGNPVTYIARGANLDALKSNGLRVIHHQGDFTVPVAATSDPSTVGPVDLVIFAVKTYDTHAALPAVTPLLAGGASVLTLQNGVESYLQLGEALGTQHVLPGAAYIESAIEAPGVIRQSGDVVRVVFGEVDGAQSPRAVQIHRAFLDAGVNCELSTDVVKTLWTKFLFITSVAGLTSACRTRISELLSEPEYMNLLLDIMREIEVVGRARGVNLDADVIAQTKQYVKAAVRDITASLHIDLEGGRRLELETFTGAVVRLGAEAGVPTPINRLLYLVLKPHVGGHSP